MRKITEAQAHEIRKEYIDAADLHCAASTHSDFCACWNLQHDARKALDKKYAEIEPIIRNITLYLHDDKQFEERMQRAIQFGGLLR